MTGSWKIGRFAGIDVFIHWTFLLLIGFIFVSSLADGQSTASALGSVLFIGALFLCVVLHEFGHALTARQFGIRTHDITLLPIGGVARLERMPRNPWQEFLVAIAGPAVNVVIAGVIFAFLFASGGLGQFALLDFTQTSFLAQIMLVNITLVLFNMLPAFPMDGGRVLRALMAMALPYGQATRVASFIGQGMAVLFVIAGFLTSHWMLALVGVFIFFGARGEARQVELETSVEGVPVHAAMATRFFSLDARAPLTEASYLSRSGQEDFPVFEGDNFVGMLYRTDLRAALGRPELLAVGDVMRRDVPQLSPNSSLTEALTTFTAAEVGTLPVVSEATAEVTGKSKLVGLLTTGSVRWWLAAQQRPRPQGDFWPRQNMRATG